MGRAVRSVEAVYAALALLLAGACTLAGPAFGARWLRLEGLDAREVGTSVTLMGVALAARLPFAAYGGALAGLQSLVLLSALQAGGATLRTVGAAAVLWWIDASPTAFFTWQAGTELALTVAGRIAVGRRLPPGALGAGPSWGTLRALAGFSAGAMMVTLAATVLGQVDRLAVSWLLALDEMGVYSVAVAAATVVLFAAYPISASYFPRLSELYGRGDGPALAACYRQGCVILGALVWPVVWMLALLASPLLWAWVQDGAVARAAAPVLTVLAFGYAATAVYLMPFSLLLVLGRPRTILAGYGLALGVLAPALVLGTTHWGIVGAAVGWTGMQVMVALWLAAMLKRLCPNLAVARAWLSGAVLRPALGAGAGGILMAAVVPTRGTAEIAAAAVCTCAAGGLGALFSSAEGRALVSRLVRAIVTRHKGEGVA